MEFIHAQNPAVWIHQLILSQRISSEQHERPSTHLCTQRPADFPTPTISAHFLIHRFKFESVSHTEDVGADFFFFFSIDKILEPKGDILVYDGPKTLPGCMP